MIKTARFRFFWSFSACSALLVATSGLAQNTIRYESQFGSMVKLEGTSSIHDWTAESKAVKGFMELDPAFDGDLKTLSSPPKVEVTIPVRQLKSSAGRLMDNNMLEHLKQKDNPDIKYTLLKLTPKTGAASQFDAQGTLTVAGVTRTNTIPVTIERVDKAKLKVKGSTTLKMTDFGIQPPTIPVLGIKTGDDVKLTFEWSLAQPENTAAK